MAALGAARVRARVAGRVHRIGYLTLRAGLADYDRAFFAGMRELGYAEGGNLAIEYGFGGNDLERMQRVAEALVAKGPDVIVVSGPATRIVTKATRTIPLVVAVADAVGQGYAASLRRPGGNVTGITLQSTELAHKRIQLLREIVPGAKRIALVAFRGGDAAVPLVRETEAAARRAGVALQNRMIERADELREAFAQFGRQAQALIVQVNSLSYDHRHAIIGLAEQHRLPALYETREFVDDGGLLSYGPDLADAFRRMASYVDRILRGAKPGELAIDQPGRFELVLNAVTAQALGLAIPQSLLLRADRVIR